MKFNERLLNLRKQKGLSQEELGYRLDVSRQTISKWEAGQTTPELEKLRLLAKEFGITVDELIDDENKNDKIEEKENKISKKKNKIKILIIFIILIAICIYIVTVIFRLKVIDLINDRIMGASMATYTNFTSEKKIMQKNYFDDKEEFNKEQYSYFRDEKLNSKQKIVYYDGYVNPVRTIYITETMDNENNAKYEIYDIDNLNMTYKISNDIPERDVRKINVDIIDSFCYTEWTNMFNISRFTKNKILLALDLRVKIYKYGDEYYLSNYDMNESKNKDSITIIINDSENSNKIIFEKTTHKEEGDYRSKTERYTLNGGNKSNIKRFLFQPVHIESKMFQVIKEEDITLPDLTGYTLVEN